MSSGGDVVFEFKHIQADVTRVVESVILRVLKGQTFAAGRVSDWNDAVTRRAVNDLVALSPNFKFVVTATIGERALTPLANARYDPSPSHAPPFRPPVGPWTHPWSRVGHVPGRGSQVGVPGRSPR